MPEHKLLSTQQAADYMGVSRQTVSNYISRGILKAFGSHNYPMVDKAAIDKIFDSINDVEASRMELAKMKEEINRDCEDTRKLLDDTRTEKTLARYLKSIPIPTESGGILAAIISSMGNHLSPRSIDILNCFLRGKSVWEISKKYNVSNARLLQVARSGVCAIQQLPKYSDLEEKIDSLEKQNKQLKSYINNFMGGRMPDGKLTEEDCTTLRLWDTDLEDLPLSVRTINGLRTVDITKLGEVIPLSKDDLRKISGIGHKCIGEIEDMLNSFGLEFCTDTGPLLRKYSRWLASHPEKEPPVTVDIDLVLSSSTKRETAREADKSIRPGVYEEKNKETAANGLSGEYHAERVASLGKRLRSEGRWHQDVQNGQREAYAEGRLEELQGGQQEDEGESLSFKDNLDIPTGRGNSESVKEKPEKEDIFIRSGRHI